MAAIKAEAEFQRGQIMALLNQVFVIHKTLENCFRLVRFQIGVKSAASLAVPLSAPLRTTLFEGHEPALPSLVLNAPPTGPNEPPLSGGFCERYDETRENIFKISSNSLLAFFLRLLRFSLPLDCSPSSELSRGWRLCD
jgi:hypothetical protein